MQYYVRLFLRTNKQPVSHYWYWFIFKVSNVLSATFKYVLVNTAELKPHRYKMYLFMRSLLGNFLHWAVCVLSELSQKHLFVFFFLFFFFEHFYFHFNKFCFSFWPCLYCKMTYLFFLYGEILSQKFGSKDYFCDRKKTKKNILFH